MARAEHKIESLFVLKRFLLKEKFPVVLLDLNNLI